MLRYNKEERGIPKHTEHLFLFSLTLSLSLSEAYHALSHSHSQNWRHPHFHQIKVYELSLSLPLSNYLISLSPSDQQLGSLSPRSGLAFTYIGSSALVHPATVVKVMVSLF
jgi:hypothetical protein